MDDFFKAEEGDPSSAFIFGPENPGPVCP